MRWKEILFVAHMKLTCPVFYRVLPLTQQLKVDVEAEGRHVANEHGGEQQGVL
jgi:hypothetical protein